MDQHQRPTNFIQLFNEREPREQGESHAPSAPKKIRKSTPETTQTVRPRGLPRPFDYFQKPASARRLFPDPEPPVPDYSSLPVPPVPYAPKCHRYRHVSRLHEGHVTIRRKLF